jgi:hypothetical protein
MATNVVGPLVQYPEMVDWWVIDDGWTNGIISWMFVALCFQIEIEYEEKRNETYSFNFIQKREKQPCPIKYKFTWKSLS